MEVDLVKFHNKLAHFHLKDCDRALEECHAILDELFANLGVDRRATELDSCISLDVFLDVAELSLN